MPLDSGSDESAAESGAAKAAKSEEQIAWLIEGRVSGAAGHRGTESMRGACDGFGEGRWPLSRGGSERPLEHRGRLGIAARFVLYEAKP